ncbi:Ankyrin repeat and SOCS box protein 15 [Myotis davidii]|uniref:Ankyrin repeat and SOCS box protein 15 n=1 Tax=Myotis davidii TaxID=225400 RepID=L5M521_MYODS|nr:Ankyrin repeat and SOCS box protein 15 [Myotis davidii]
MCKGSPVAEEQHFLRAALRHTHVIEQGFEEMVQLQCSSSLLKLANDEGQCEIQQASCHFGVRAEPGKYLLGPVYVEFPGQILMKLLGPSAEELLTQGPETVKVKEIPQGVRVSPSTQQNLRPLQNGRVWLGLAFVENFMDSNDDPDEDNLTSYDIQLSIQESIEASKTELYPERFVPLSDQNRKLVEAIKHGHILELQEYVKYKYALDEADERGWFPLHEAVVQPIQQILEIVLDASYKTLWEFKTADGETPLTLAVKAGLVENQDSSLDQPGVKRWSAMHEAAKQGRKDLVALLLRHGGSVHLRDGFGVTPLGVAAEYGHCDVLEHLIHKGGDVFALADDGASVLFEAAGGGNPDCISLLLEYGGSGNVPNRAGHLPIHRAAYEGHYL